MSPIYDSRAPHQSPHLESSPTYYYRHPFEAHWGWALDPKLYYEGRFRRSTVTSKENFVAFSMLFVLNFLIMLVWTLVVPVEYKIHVVEGEEWKFYCNCTSMDAGGWSFLVLTTGLNFFALVLACYQAYQARNISDEYSETSKSLGIAVFSVGSQILLWQTCRA